MGAAAVLGALFVSCVWVTASKAVTQTSTTRNLAIPRILEAGDPAWAPVYLGSDRIELQLVFKLGSVYITPDDSWIVCRPVILIHMLVALFLFAKICVLPPCRWVCVVQLDRWGPRKLLSGFCLVSGFLPPCPTAEPAAVCTLGFGQSVSFIPLDFKAHPY